VARFYQLVDQRQFDAAAQLWSARMRAEYPPAQNIHGRFDTTRDLTLRRADVASVDQAGGRAEVAIDLLETTGAGSRRWVGSWYLVRGGAGWLLDQPSLAPG
jgi:hypothetical protein